MNGMPNTIRVRGREDARARMIVDALTRGYLPDHPVAEVEAYRYNSLSIRVRIVDPAFKGLNRIEREDLVWEHLKDLPDPVQIDISMLVLVTPEEKDESLSSLEFEDPRPSNL